MTGFFVPSASRDARLGCNPHVVRGTASDIEAYSDASFHALTMPYIRRTPTGAIQSLHLQPEAGADEFLPDQHADVQAFVGRPASDASYSKLDADFVRVLEDLIDTLIVKNILNITDLPPEAQAKLLARKGFRERQSKSSLRLFAPSGTNDVI